MFLDEKQQGEAQTAEQANRKMNLSEAIRIGAAKRPQCTGYLFHAGRSCALGAAYEGLGHSPIEGQAGTPGYVEQYDRLYTLYGMPICDRVQSLNDSGKTREQIAERLEAQGL